MLQKNMIGYGMAISGVSVLSGAVGHSNPARKRKGPIDMSCNHLSQMCGMPLEAVIMWCGAALLG